ncbi:MAG: hypothetical protein ACFCU7_06710 [Pleurocapsa sp.]
MSRIKIFLLLLIIAALSIIFLQNREPITLQLLCPDNASSSCLYQTVPLPLAVWIGLFILNGAIINLLVQFLSAYGYSNSNRQKYALDDDLYAKEQNWQPKSRNEYAKSAALDDSLIQDKFPNVSTYEVKQEPQNVERSGSTYSYKYREASDRPKDERYNAQKTSAEPEINANVTPEQDDEDWI